MHPPLATLLEGLIDYAGLFPPAALPMDQAVARYAAHLAGPDRPALGRFIVPAQRLAEFEQAAAGGFTPGRPWRLSVLVGTATGGEVAEVRRFNLAHAVRQDAVADVLEGKATSPDGVTALATAAGPPFTLYVEVPTHPDPTPLIAAIGAAGARAKIRTGGVTPEAIPGTAEVARFLAACVHAGVGFKATAGLHHPIRGRYPLTYAPDAPRAVMHGYLNVFLAAALLEQGGSLGDATDLLEETDLAALEVGAQAMTWRGHRFDEAGLAALRRQTALGFGSCSFDEPLDDLRTAGLH